MMNSSKFPFSLILLFLLALASCMRLPKTGATEVTVTGLGATPQEARQDAIRRGLQFAVGSYVSSDMEVRNDQIIRDEINDYSGAFVERFVILNQVYRSDGYCQIQARIKFAGGASRQANHAPLVSTSRIDGQSFHAKVVSQIREQADAEKLWRNLLNDFVGKAFRFVVLNPQVYKIPDSSTGARLEFSTVILWRKDYLAELKDLLTATGRPLPVSLNIPYAAYSNNGRNEDAETGVCLKFGFLKPDSSYSCYVINIPSEKFRSWICWKNEPKMTFNLPDVDEKSLNFQRKPSMGIPYLEFTYNATTSIFVFYIVEPKMLEQRNEYLQHVSTGWSVNLPVEMLPSIRNISVKGECGK